jgi:DNA-binding phage protein
MALTRSFKELVQKRVAADPAFGQALLREGIDTMLTGDVDTGKAILRDYIKATVGFEKLGEATGTQAKSLIRMFGPRGNPQARNLFSIIGYLQKQAGVELHVTQAPGGNKRRVWRSGMRGRGSVRRPVRRMVTTSSCVKL